MLVYGKSALEGASHAAGQIRGDLSLVHLNWLLGRDPFDHRADVLQTSNDLDGLKLCNLALRLLSTVRKGLLGDDFNRLVSQFVRTQPIGVGVVNERTALYKVLDDEEVTMLGSDVQWSVPQSLSLLVYVLPFPNKHSHKVKVALLARPPNVTESFLTIVTLAVVEGEFVLSGPHVDQDVIIGLPLEQLVADSSMAIVGRVVEWGPLSMVLRVDVCPTLKEKHYSCQATFLAGQVQGSTLQVVLPFHLCLVDQQSLH